MLRHTQSEDALWSRTILVISSSGLWSLGTDLDFSCSFCLSVIAVLEGSMLQHSRHSDVTCLPHPLPHGMEEEDGGAVGLLARPLPCLHPVLCPRDGWQDASEVSESSRTLRP